MVLTVMYMEQKRRAEWDAGTPMQDDFYQAAMHVPDSIFESTEKPAGPTAGPGWHQILK